MKKSNILISTSILFFSFSPFAYAHNFIYVAADAGIFQADYNQQYLDQTDVIAENIAESVQQHGYTGGIAIGYRHFLKPDYFLGTEFSGNVEGQQASFQSGASNAAFSDETRIRYHFDWVMVPGINLNSSISAYLKLGLSYAGIQDHLSSPAGYTPESIAYNDNKNVIGFAAGLGFSKSINDCLFLFTEASYHDYGTVDFPGFQNFTADYNHSAHVYSYGVVVGAAYAVPL